MNINVIVFQLTIGTILVDALVEFIKLLLDRYFKTKNIKYKNTVLRSISVLVGIIICFSYHLDIAVMAGLHTDISYIGKIITGILISRGSNTIHDLFKKYGLKNTKL